MRNIFRAAALAMAALGVGGAPYLAAQQTIENAPDPYVHKRAGVAFPLAAGPFERGRVVEYDETGADASVGYTPSWMAGEISLYLYPLGGLSCAEHFDGASEAVTARGGTIALSDAGVTMPGFTGAAQLSRSFAIAPGGYGFDHGELVSVLWVGCPAGGDWIVKYRGSFLAEDADAIYGVSQVLFTSIDWGALTSGG